MLLAFRPIKVWPDGWQDPNRASYRTASPFTAGYSDTLTILDRELDALDTADAFLQVAATDRDCRLDGQLRADAKVTHPGVILTIESDRFGTLAYPCDRFIAPSWRHNPGESWQHNLRAIALGLEALRKVERYGIAERGQQYAGYRELPSGIAVPAAMTVDEAAALLVAEGEWGERRADPGDLIGDPYVVGLYYRHAARRHHPDAGGDAEMFRRLTNARDLLVAAAR